MSKNARGKGSKPALGAIGARQFPSVVQPSGMNVDELTDLDELMAGPPQMGQQETPPEEKETPPAQRRRQQA
ncbi:MAG TPA: hypothetical protein VKZ46_00915 [Pedomonas sp.]|nr:hypothetical protein [Pedomonas sp.]